MKLFVIFAKTESSTAKKITQLKVNYMGNPYFQFKDFTIWHDKCAMKVGTDSVLLGAWAVLRGETALDIGCGTGILAIMLASRSNLHIHAVDIDAPAIAQTLENAALTPWKERITAETADIRTYNAGRKFDTILSNPPFYTENTLPDGKARQQARNASSLSYGDLVEAVMKHLSPQGVFNVILPASSEMDFRGIAVENGLHPVRSLSVSTVEGKVPKRVLMAFSPEDACTEKREHLSIHAPGREYTEAYRQLVGGFYLNM